MKRVRAQSQISLSQPEVIYHSLQFTSQMQMRRRRNSRGFITSFPLHRLPLGVRHPCKAEKAVFPFNGAKRREDIYLKTVPYTLPISLNLMVNDWSLGNSFSK